MFLTCIAMADMRRNILHPLVRFFNRIHLCLIQRECQLVSDYELPLRIILADEQVVCQRKIYTIKSVG